MNDRTPMARDRETENARSSALCTVQGVGCLLAFFCAWHLHRCAQLNARLEPWLIGTVAAVGLVTVATIFCHAHMLPLITKGFKLPAVGGLFTSDTLLPFYSLMNTFGLAFCLYTTGGADKSPFTAFLLTLVPVAIALGDNRWWVLVYSVLTISIFCASLRWYDHTFAPRSDSDGLKLWFGGIAAACAAFPAILYVLIDDHE